MHDAGVQDLAVATEDIGFMQDVDVAIVIGANAVVNPVARTDPQSPIAGMPIIDVDKARTVFVVKRSLSAGRLRDLPRAPRGVRACGRRSVMA